MLSHQLDQYGRSLFVNGNNPRQEIVTHEYKLHNLVLKFQNAVEYVFGWEDKGFPTEVMHLFERLCRLL